jgi:gamma-butyrobetaine dioxygenase
MTAVETIGELFAGPDARDHMGEPVPIGEHMLQAGALAEAAGAERALVAAALLHVPAKRYLCGADAEYFGLLSSESVRTLALQGGPMTEAEVAAFEALPYSRDAVAVRRWDDQAKDPAVTAPGFAHFAPLLGALVRS